MENQRDVDGMWEPRGNWVFQGKYVEGLRGKFSVFVEKIWKELSKSSNAVREN